VGSVVGDIVPLAVGIALGPFAIIGVLLVHFAKRPALGGVLFLAGWVLGLATVAGVVYGIASAFDFSASGPPMAANVIKILLGLVLLAFAVRQLGRRPEPVGAAKMPKWLPVTERLTPAKSFVFGALIAGVHPLNVTLTLAAALTVAQAGLSGTAAAVSLILFVVIASTGVALPVAFYNLRSAKAAHRFGGWKTWLIGNDITVMLVVYLLLGVVLISRGIRGLTG
jgi:hypothetical protein